MSDRSPKVPSVSVVIPTYNRADTVVEAVESVLAQTIAPLEIIVVDDGSTDDTRDRMAGFGDRVVFLSQANRGVSAARNLGIEQARGHFIAFLDSDDVWHPKKLELQLLAFARNPEYGLIGTRSYDWPGSTPAIVDDQIPSSLPPIPWDELAVRNYIITSTVMIRRETLMAAGPFDTDLQGPEDYDLWLRVIRIAPVANLALPLTGYRITAGSLSAQPHLMETASRRILQKLDEQGAWGTRRLLRRKAYSRFHFTTAITRSMRGEYSMAWQHLVSSFVWYPFPYCMKGEGVPMARAVAAVVYPIRMLTGRRLGTRKAPLFGRSAPAAPGAIGEGV